MELVTKTPDEIFELLGLDKKYNARQIYNHILRGTSDFSKMTDLSLSLRSVLSAKFSSAFSSSVAKKEEDEEGNVKLAVRLSDNEVVECVLLTDKEGNRTACISSQVGCAMGCAFCRTGTLKLKRNLHSYEIVEQFLHLKSLGYDISHIVFMGMGEPMANINNVLESIKFFTSPSALGIGVRRITVSTCGVVGGIKRLAKEKTGVKLAVSLVSADNVKRSRLMPVNRTFDLGELRKALLEYQDACSRRFTLEYCMISGVNIGKQDAVCLASFCRGLEAVVNLIPFNECPELDFKTPDRLEIRTFTDALTSLGVHYTIRVSRGRTIRGACGQLAAKMV